MSAGAYGTTYQATDFKDIEGDRILGRNTIPIAAPVLARPTLLVLMCVWSIFLSTVWELGALATLTLNALGFVVGARFMLCRSVAEDKQSCLLYNVSYCSSCSLRDPDTKAMIFIRFGCHLFISFPPTGGFSHQRHQFNS